MKIRRFLLLKALLISTFLLISACEEDKPKVSVNDHLDLARLYLKQGSFKASMIEGRNALQIDPNNIEALTTMATVLLKLNAVDTAANLVKKAVEIEPKNQDTKLLLTKAYLAQRKLFSARNTFKSIDASAVKNISNYQSTYGSLLQTSNKHSEAKEWFQKSYASDPKNIQAILGIARTSLQLKQLDDVNKYTQLAIESSSNDVEALLWSARVSMLRKNFVDAENTLSKLMVELERYDTLTINKYMAIDMLAKALVAQGKIEESFTYSNYLAQSKPGQIQASFKNALELISSDGKLNKAEQAFQEVLDQAPSHRTSNIMMGLINYNKGDYAQAETYLSKFSDDESTPLRSKKILALTKIKLRKPSEAIELINANIKEHNKDPDLFALLGFAHLTKGDYTDSIDALKKAISFSGNNSIYYTHLAQAYLANKELTASKETIKKALKIKPDSDQARRILASIYVLNKEIPKAKAYARQWIKVSPKSVAALMVAAEIEQIQKNTKKARTLYLKALTLDPNNLISNMNIVRMDLTNNDNDKAIERLNRIINKHPENMAALNILYNLAVTPSSTKKVTDIITSVNSKHPFAINTRLTLARLLLSKRQTDKALNIINDVTKLDNKNIKAYFLKAKALQSQNKITQAKDTYKLLISLAPKNTAGYIELARMYIQSKEYKAAIDYAKQAEKIKSNYIPAHLVFFSAGLKTSDKAMVMSAINNIQKIMPKSHLAYELEADYYLDKKQYKQSLAKLKQAWAIKQSIQMANKFQTIYNETNQSSLAFDAWNELASSKQNDFKVQLGYAIRLYQDKQLNKAKSVLEAQLTQYPENVVLLNNLANIYLELNDKNALKIAQKALSIHPDSPAIQDTVGWIYAQQNKDYEKAIELLEPAYKASLDNTIKQHLITALTNAGRTAEANALKNQ